MANFDEISMVAIAEVIDDAAGAVAEPRRPFYHRINAFELGDRQFVRMFRLSKELVREVIGLVSRYIEDGSRGSTTNIETQVLVSLRFLASGSYQLDSASNIHVAISQSSVSRCIEKVINALNQRDVFNRFVSFPRNMQELERNRNRFYEKFNFPGVVGCIDCTHVAIIAPPKNDPIYNEYVYVNRKNYHFINVQLICDSRMKIINVNVLYPGSTNNAFIWNNSNVQEVMQNIHRNKPNQFYLLGDSGYPLRPWLLSPLENEPLPGSPEAEYDRCHKRTRCIIERCNGLLKMRFRCLLKHRVLHYHPEKAARILNACVVLHNLCIEHNVPAPEPEDGDEHLDLGILDDEERGQEEAIGARVNPQLQEGRRLQRRLIQNYFTN